MKKHFNFAKDQQDWKAFVNLIISDLYHKEENTVWGVTNT